VDNNLSHLRGKDFYIGRGEPRCAATVKERSIGKKGLSYKGRLSKYHKPLRRPSGEERTNLPGKKGNETEGTRNANEFKIDGPRRSEGEGTGVFQT